MIITTYHGAQVVQREGRSYWRASFRAGGAAHIALIECRTGNVSIAEALRDAALIEELRRLVGFTQAPAQAEEETDAEETETEEEGETVAHGVGAAIRAAMIFAASAAACVAAMSQSFSQN